MDNTTQMTPYRKLAEKIICKIFGHKWRYNFPSLPSCCICKRCYRKKQVDLKTLKWHSISTLKPITGTDKEIAERWFKLPINNPFNI